MTKVAPLDLIPDLLRRWRLIVLCSILGLAGGAAYALLAPEWFAATLTVVPSQNSKESAAMGLASKLPFAIDALSSETDVRRIQAVLNSVSVADEVIDKFKLSERYDTSHREQTRKTLWEHCVSDVDRKSNVVSLTCEDKVPEQAMAMATYFGEVGNRVFGRISSSSAREERRFLEAQVVKARQDVDLASSKLRTFQEQHKIIDLPEQSKAVISAMASMKGELLSKQLELSYLDSFASRTEANVVQLHEHIDILQAKLAQLEASQDVALKPSEFFPGAMTVPSLRFELEQLIRQQKIQETVFFLMTQRFEMAKVDEARDTSTFQILDSPTLPTYRMRPKRLKVTLTGFGVGLGAAITIIVLLSLLKRRADEVV